MIDQGRFVIRLTFPGVKLNNLKDVGLGPLGRIDQATLEPGMVVPMHLHQNDELLSYVRKGVLLHKDSNGNEVPVHSTHLMMMNAGSGIWHEESVPFDSGAVDLLQIFIRPEDDGLEPAVQFHSLDTADSTGEWRLIAGPAGSGAPLLIRSDIRVYDTHLSDSALRTPELQGLTGFLYVFDGRVTSIGKNLRLEKGDTLIVKEERLQLQAAGEANLVFFVINERAEFTRSGRYSG